MLEEDTDSVAGRIADAASNAGARVRVEVGGSCRWYRWRHKHEIGSLTTAHRVGPDVADASLGCLRLVGARVLDDRRRCSRQRYELGQSLGELREVAHLSAGGNERLQRLAEQFDVSRLYFRLTGAEDVDVGG